MFHPVGNQAASVYWRRRLFVGFAVVALFALIVATAKVAFGGGSTTPVAGGTSSSSAPVVVHTSSAPPRTTTPPSTHASTPAGHTSPGSGSPTSVVPQACAASQLSVAAVTGKPSYAVGAEPVLSLQVTNTGSAPCTQNLADSQIVLRVYNGVSRVWGSHDCEVQPGTDVRTLAANTPVKISVVWSGKSSEPNCAGQRQQVGAGTYTLYATLSGHDGKAAQFAIH